MLKKISEELVSQIMSKVSSKDYDERDCETLKIEIDNVTYRFKGVKNSGWEDDGRGKYDLSTIIFQLVEFDKKYKIKNEFDAYFEQSSSRTGSYYTEYTYGYDELVRLKRVEKVIPEQIIPKHTVVVWEKY